MDALPEDCVHAILSYTSPAEASRCSVVSSTFLSASVSDMVWESFLPSDYDDIVSRALVPLRFSSKKDLFFALSRPLLIDGGNKSFNLDKKSGKITYILSARELCISWSDDPLLWSWIPLRESRFPVVAVLRTVGWLEIEGKIRTGSLSPSTWYGAYMIMKVSERAYGLESAVSRVRVQVGSQVKSGRAYLWHEPEQTKMIKELFYGERREIEEERVGIPRKRGDGWMEIKVGEFFCRKSDEEVKIRVTELGYQLKGGLILEGIEVRPKQY
ncbi:F-box protein PP2-B15-like [Neltuma alba]|uniref:F-box protein PP2-B15-like n=1 Tax=Neltuma alba TaxID=207710 RepID=UPI0010A42F3F|nr:F-box protein PP2-B15-like [Prosopis alba]